MPGTLAINEVVKVDDPTCCRVYEGWPIEVGDATLLSFSYEPLVTNECTGRTPVLRGH